MSTVDMLKKSLAFTIGAAEFSAEKVRQFADEMVSRGEMSQEEAKKFVDDVSNKAEEEKKSIHDWMREQASKVLSQAGAAEAARLERLEQRVTLLERRVAELSIATSPAAETVCVVDSTGQCATGPVETE